MNWVFGSGLMTNPVLLLSVKAVVNGPAISLGTSWNGIPPMREFGQFVVGHLVEPRPHLLGDAHADLVGGDLRSSNHFRVSGLPMMSSSSLSS